MRPDAVTPKVQLDEEQCHVAWMTRVHSDVVPCLDEIQKQLFANEKIMMYRNHTIVDVSLNFERFLLQDLVPFAKIAFLTINAFGVLPVAYRRTIHGIGTDALAPYVPTFGTYDIWTWADHGVQQFELRWKHSPDKADLSVTIFTDASHLPNLDGTLTSNLYTCYLKLEWITEMQELAIRGERIRSNPPVVQEFRPLNDDEYSGANREALRTKPFAGAALTTCEEKALRSQERTAEEIEKLMDTLMNYEESTKRSAHKEFGIDLRRRRQRLHPKTTNQSFRAHAEHEQPWDSQLYLPPERVMRPIQMPVLRSDLVNLSNQCRESIYSILKVPIGYMRHTSTARSGVAATEAAMYKTVMYWADVLSNIITDIYDHLFGAINLKEELRREYRVSKKLTQHGACLTEDAVVRAVARSKTTLRFDVVPAVDADELRLLRDEGYITNATAARDLLRINNLPLIQQNLDLPDHPVPISEPPPAKKRKPSESRYLGSELL